MITCITPTGDRPEVFELCKLWMSRQAILPDQWIVVDDGKIPLVETFMEGMEYVRRKPSPQGKHTLTKNLKTALPFVKGDKILIIEDDDWYGPNYIKTMSEYLERYDLAGEIKTRYYHVPTMRYYRAPNIKHASLCQTAFNKTLMPKFISCLEGDAFLDIRFWAAIEEKKYLFEDIEDVLHLHCGMKGLKGRRGIGMGHNSKAKHYSPDNHLFFLTKWIGEDNAKIYMDHVGQSFENAKFVDFIRPLFKLPAVNPIIKEEVKKLLEVKKVVKFKTRRSIVLPKPPIAVHPRLRPVKRGDFSRSTAIGPDGKRIMPKNWR